MSLRRPRVLSRIVSLLGLAWLLGAISPAQAEADTSRQALEDRVLAVRTLLHSSASQQTDASDPNNPVAQWLNWPNWNNWNNWPNWGNWNNWVNWFNR